MKSNKGVVFACLLFVAVIVIASTVSEGNQEQHEKAEGAVGNYGNEVAEDSKQASRCRYGCCRYSGYRCIKCCGSVAEQAARQPQNNGEDQESEVDTKGLIGGGKGGKGGKGGGKGGKGGKGKGGK